MVDSFQFIIVMIADHNSDVTPFEIPSNTLWNPYAPFKILQCRGGIERYNEVNLNEVVISAGYKKVL